MSALGSLLTGRRVYVVSLFGFAVVFFALLWAGLSGERANAAFVQGREFPWQILAVAQSATVTVTNNVFISQTVEIQAGDTVTWTRLAGTHSVTADDGSFEQPLGSAWTTFSRKFDIPGEYLYYCSLHGGPNGIAMAGKVIVLGNSSPTPTATPTSTPPAPTPTATATATPPASGSTYLPWVKR